MDKQIEVGDLVVVVKPTPCCGNNAAVGHHYTVSAILTVTDACFFCGTLFDNIIVAEVAERDGQCLLNRLKRIPPLSELESINTQEKMEA